MGFSLLGFVGALVVVGLAWVVYGALLVPRLVRVARRDPARAVEWAAFALAALAVRLALAPRGPILAAQADFGHIEAALELVRGNIANLATYPPTAELPLALVLWPFGASPGVAFGFLALVGALAPVVVHVATEALADSRRAARFAALAATVAPIPVFLSNGVNLELYGLLLALAALAHGVAYVRRASAREAASLTVALVLLAHVRSESCLAVVLLVAVLAAWALRDGVAVARLRNPATWPALVLPLVLWLPWMAFQRQSLQSLQLFLPALAWALGGAAAALGLGLGLGLWRRRGERVAGSAGGSWSPRAEALLVVGVVALVVSLRSFDGRLLLEGPRAWWSAAVSAPVLFERRGEAGAGGLLLDGRLVPLAHVILGLLAFLRLRASGAGGRGGFLAAALLFLAVAGSATMRAVGHSGELAWGGTRYEYVVLGFVLVLVGLGADRLLGALSSRRLQLAVGALLVAVTCSPLLTHGPLLADDRDDQRLQVRLLREALPRVAPGTTIVLPDHACSAAEGPASAAEHRCRDVAEDYRTAAMVRVLAREAGVPVRVERLAEWADHPDRDVGTPLFFHGADCYLVPAGLQSEACRVAEERGGARAFAARSESVRRYSAGPCPERFYGRRAITIALIPAAGPLAAELIAISAHESAARCGRP